MDVQTIKLPPEFAREVLMKAERYGVTDVDVENSVSVVDDMLGSAEEKLRYAREKMDESNVDKAFLVIHEGRATLILNLENVVEIRVGLEKYRDILAEVSAWS